MGAQMRCEAAVREQCIRDTALLEGFIDKNHHGQGGANATKAHLLYPVVAVVRHQQAAGQTPLFPEAHHVWPIKLPQALALAAEGSNHGEPVGSRCPKERIGNATLGGRKSPTWYKTQRDKIGAGKEGAVGSGGRLNEARLTPV